MNERIRELAIKSGIDIRGHLSGVLTLDEKPTVFDLEKFAELIVKECMSVARQQRNPANLNYKPSERFVEDLRQHFGIEEWVPIIT